MAMGHGFVIIQSGSTATSAATAHLLFGAYGGLSQFNNEQQVNIHVFGSAADLMVGTSAVTNDTGLKISVAASLTELPPMRAGDASLLHFARHTTNNGTFFWTVWRRTMV